MHHLPFGKNRRARQASHDAATADPLIVSAPQPTAPLEVADAVGHAAVHVPTHHLKYVPIGKKSGLLHRHATHHIYEFDNPHSIAPHAPDVTTAVEMTPVGAGTSSAAAATAAPIAAATDTTLTGPPRHPHVGLEEMSTTTMTMTRDASGIADSSLTGASTTSGGYAPLATGTDEMDVLAAEQQSAHMRHQHHHHHQHMSHPQVPHEVELLAGAFDDPDAANMSHPPVLPARDWVETHYGHGQGGERTFDE